ncbi:MAG: PKD domain-containing protein, partial [Bacteroidetes bacterium]|nr:PKD domain-containing protein [Bacteroidota bacterium]
MRSEAATLKRMIKKLLPLWLVLSLFVPLSMLAQPANDDCTNAQPISIPVSGQACVAGTTIGATSLTWTSGACGQNVWTNDVWYTFVSTGSYTTVTVTPGGSTPATQMGVAIYTTTNCSNYAGAGGGYCNIATGSNAAFAIGALPAGTTFYVEVSSFGTAGTFDICVNSTEPPASPGSTCATATRICSMSPFSLASVPTGGSGFRPDCFRSNPTAGVWYQFTVGVGGQLAFTCDPTGAGIELDWALYDLASGCPTNADRLTAQLTCNYNYAGSFSDPIGMSPTSTTNCPVNNATLNPNKEFCPSQTVTAGHTYAIFINNYSAPSATGWDFDFTGSTFQMAPINSFTVSPDTICGNTGTVTVTNNSAGANWQLWNFGDNTTSLLASPPAHNYTAPGTYFITLKDSTATGCTSTTSKSILITPSPAVTVPNDTACSGSVSLTATPSVPGGTYQWSNSATTAAISVNPATTTTYTVTYTSPTGCTGTGSGTVVRSGSASAGPDQAASCVTSFPGGSVTMAGTGTGTWTLVTPAPGTATISAPSSPASVIHDFSAAGTYAFTWGSGSCVDTALIVVSGNASGGPDRFVSCVALPGGSTSMAATGAGTWSLLTPAPGSATITPASSPTATVSGFTAPGVYSLLWTSSGGCTDTATVTVIAKADAGADQTVSCASLPGGTATMAATGAGTWSLIRPLPGTCTLAPVTSPTATVSDFSAAGVYVLKWTNISGCSDTATVTVTGKADAGPDQMISCAILPGGTAVMSAQGTGSWMPCPGMVLNGWGTITNAVSPTTTIVVFSAPDTFPYVWTTAAGCQDTANVIVTAKPNAGADKTVACVALPGGSATMSAAGTGTWSLITPAPGTATIAPATSPTATASAFSAAGVYYFKWSDASGCSDTATVTVTAKADAGPDQHLTCYPLNNTVTMAATSTGTWSAAGGNPGTATISAPSTNNTTITNFSALGTYTFVWASGGCTDSALVFVTSRTNAGSDQSICQYAGTILSAAGSGTWSEQPGNPSSPLIFSNTSDPATSVTGFDVPGVYHLIWSSGGCEDTMQVTVRAKPDA